MTSSLYNSATGVQAPHCLHAIGIGRTGMVYIEALLRTGEIEDMLADPRATFAAMVVDIGDQDMGIVTDYANSFKKRLESRGIPSDRFSFQAVALPIRSRFTKCTCSAASTNGRRRSGAVVAPARIRSRSPTTCAGAAW